TAGSALRITSRVTGSSDGRLELDLDAGFFRECCRRGVIGCLLLVAREQIGAATAVCSLPPCGGGVGRGVTSSSVLVATPLPVPPPQGGREPCSASLQNATSRAQREPSRASYLDDQLAGGRHRTGVALEQHGRGAELLHDRGPCDLRAGRERVTLIDR